MPTHGPAGPVIVGERVRPDANLSSQAPDDRRCKVDLFVWETAVLAPKRKLRRKAELAGVGEVGQMRQIAGQKRPVLVKLACRPLLPHCRTPSTPNERRIQAGNQRRNVRWPKCTASWSLGPSARSQLRAIGIAKPSPGIIAALSMPAVGTHSPWGRCRKATVVRDYLLIRGPRRRAYGEHVLAKPVDDWTDNAVD